MSTNTATAAAALAHKFIGDDSTAYEHITKESRGAGKAIAKADETIASARDTLASLLPLAVTFAFMTRAAKAMTDRAGAEHLGIKPDSFALYAIAGALHAHGMDAAQARADVIAAVNGAGASKPVLWAAAVESQAAFRKAVREAEAAAKAKAEAKAEAPKAEAEGTEESDPTEGAQVTEETPEARGHALLLAIAGPCSALVKALGDGTAVLSPADVKALGTVLLAVAKSTGAVSTVPTKAKAARVAPEAKAEARNNLSTKSA
jgi:hypothetical protein